MRLRSQRYNKIFPKAGPGWAWWGSLLVFCLGLVLTFVLYCKVGNKTTSARVTIRLSAHKRDVFQLFYECAGDADFSESNSTKFFIDGRKRSDELSFDIPTSRLLHRLRLDLGANPLQASVYIQSIFLSYEGDTLTLFDGVEENVFTPNWYIKIKGHICELINEPGKGYDPYLYSRFLAIDYENLVNGQKKMPAVLLLPLACALILHVLFFRRRSSFHESFYAYLAGVFILLLLFPTLNTYFDLYKDQNREQKMLAEKPLLTGTDLSNYPREFDAYFNDHFGYRSWLIEIGGKIGYYVLKTSVAPGITLVGKKGWTFYAQSLSLDARPLPDSTLKRMLRVREERQEFLRSQGVKYYIAIWPEKQAIYSDYLPFNVQIAMAHSIPWIKQVKDYFQKNGARFSIVDANALLLEEKKRRQVYLKYDSHWNAAGAFVGYTSLLKTLSADFPQLKPHPFSDYTVTYKLLKGGDLVNPMGIHEDEMIPVYRLIHDSSDVRDITPPNSAPGTIIYENHRASTTLTVVIYHDSYMYALSPFLLSHFRKLILLWRHPLSKELIKAEKPDLVIDCRVSRHIESNVF